IQVRKSKPRSDPETTNRNQSGTLSAKNRHLKATPAMSLIARTQSPLNVDVTIANRAGWPCRSKSRIFMSLLSCIVLATLILTMCDVRLLDEVHVTTSQLGVMLPLSVRPRRADTTVSVDQVRLLESFVHACSQR